MTGSCHCGAVEVTIATKPDYINLCDCTLCAKSGGAWAYFTGAEVAVTGPTNAYRRVDREKPACEMQFCPNCGTTTHWTLTEHFDGDKVGVNMRIFSPSQAAGIKAYTLDGRGWSGDSDPAQHRAPGRLGEDVFL